MIKIYTSNSFNNLIKKMCYIMNIKSSEKIFIKEIIVVPELKISKFIRQIIEKKFGIFCNISFFTPEKFIFYILELFINKKKYKKFNQSYILWKLMSLPEKFQKKYFFKKKENEFNKFKYFKNFSKIFYKYLIYNTKLIKKLEKNTKKNKKKIFLKQQKIWKKINKNLKNTHHYVNLIKNFMKKYYLKKNLYKKLPNRIFILNPIDFPISYFNILKKISEKLKIYFFLYTPFKKINKKSIINYKKNSIISNWMKYDLKKIKNILSLTKNKKNIYIKNKNITLLDKLKNKIFFLKNNSIYINQKKDNSISIHECYNHFREIEILQENILKILNNTKTIQPKHIIVKSKNIQKYIPYINSIFNSEIKKNNIPYFIHEKIFDKNNPIIYIFNKILSLPQSKFKNKKILDYLNFKFISKKFLISQKELKIIKKWISYTNICWGINKNHKKSLKLPEEHQNTWSYGIKKIILGYGMKKKNKVWNKIFPYNINEKNHILILEKLILFIKTLKKWKKKLSTKKKCKTWKKIYKEIINDFFYTKKIKKKLKHIKKNWKYLLKNIQISSYKKKISIDIIKYEINKKINIIYKREKKNNNIIFTNFNLLRTIPFKITYILGMNENFFKNKTQERENLIHLYNKKENFKKNTQDYYIFLELLSCTTKKLIISYIKNSYENEKNNKPSIIIYQLIKYIKKNFLKDYKKIQLIKIHEKYSFYKKNFYLKNKFNSFNNFWNISKNKKKIIKTNFFKKNIYIKNYKKIKFKNFILFWKNPINYFFNKILKIYYKEKYINYSNNEPFYIDKKNHYLLNKKILNYIIFKKNLKKLFNKIKYLGILPHGNLGKIYFKHQIKKNNKIFLKIKNINFTLKNKKFLLKIKKYKIYGKLKNISSLNGVVRWKSFNLNNFDKISLWLKHIIYCANGGKKNSIYISLNKKITFKNITKKKSKKYLLKYIYGYIQGLKNPLIITKTGLNWFDYVYDKKIQNISKNKKIIKNSKNKIFETWHGNKYIIGEKKDLYIKKIFNSLNKKSIKKIFRITKYWMYPIYKNIL
ncbi:RecBCD enzyme subunit RecC [Buchnera aphidicola (Periphyllus testudinaceus)]|uniref:exodeoxyribonuclease V subunit gamma n=1 Tax=Buchnera aphidicola TaxID=9 RepID=UPI003463DAAF